jgi:predicted HNH restriction endonuclease
LLLLLSLLDVFACCDPSKCRLKLKQLRENVANLFKNKRRMLDNIPVTQANRALSEWRNKHEKIAVAQ